MKKVLILLIIPLFSFTVHKYYLALTEIEYKEEEQTVQMIMNVFVDDIELALNSEFEIDAQLTTKKELDNIDDYFYKYLKENYLVKINNIQRDYKFIGKEYDGNIVYFYLEINDINNFDTIEIENKVLIRYFPEQQNLIKVTKNKKRKSLFLNKKNDKGLLKF